MTRFGRFGTSLGRQSGCSSTHSLSHADRRPNIDKVVSDEAAMRLDEEVEIKRSFDTAGLGFLGVIRV